MKSLITSLAILCLLPTTGSVDAEPRNSELSPAQLASIHGRIQFVTSFPDYKVKIVSSFPDLKVQKVSSFADSAGKWQIVDSFPDYKIQIVDSFPDFRIQYVQAFPGLP